MIDSHCHLAGEEFSADLADVIGRAREADVETVLCILEAEDAAEISRAAVLRAAWPTIRFSTGIHPHHAVKFSGDTDRAMETVVSALNETGACAVGEIGLDYHYDFSPRDVQQELFRAQLRLAAERGLPAIIHTREATEDTLRILKEEGCERGVFHCFTGDRASARQALDTGFHLSFAGILTFPKASELREVAADVPADRVLSETDAPYLAPVPHRGKRNEPAFVVRVVETLAELRRVPVDEIRADIRRNFHDLFG